MGLGLILRARARDSESFGAIEQLIDARFHDLVVRSASDEGRYVVQLHPAAEDVEFSMDDGVIVVSAKTSTVGPGYHAFLCELLHRLGGELDLAWTAGEDEGDETGYFLTSDRGALEGEMLAWLRGLCGMLAEQIDQGSTGFMISLPIDTVFEFEGALATPMGPRDAAWVSRVHGDPRQGIDLFPWWEPGRGARYLRDRAITRMWTEVRWREPVSESEQELLEAIDDDLGAAHEADSSLELPWAEWAEIAGLLGYDDPTSGRGARRPATIGYRRNLVRVSLTGGWTVRVPGHMSTEFDDEGTWSAFTPGRTIWMSSFRIGDADAPTLTAAETLPKRDPKGDPIELPDLPPELAYRAYTSTTNEGHPQLTLQIAIPHRIAVFTIVHEDPHDLDWAKRTASSVRHG